MNEPNVVIRASPMDHDEMGASSLMSRKRHIPCRGKLFPHVMLIPRGMLFLRHALSAPLDPAKRAKWFPQFRVSVTKGKVRKKKKEKNVTHVNEV